MLIFIVALNVTDLLHPPITKSVTCRSLENDLNLIPEMRLGKGIVENNLYLL
jgi:hypothetical protein